MAKPGVKEMRDICNDGDIVLIVGPEKLELQVSSAVLRRSSKVFAAMLGPNWRESGAEKVELPEDHGIAMHHICLALHCRLPIPLQTPGSNTLLKIIGLSDKYFLDNALFYAARFWLQQKTLNPQALLELTTVAYVFKDENAFKAFTKDLVLKYDSPYVSLLTTEISQWLDLAVLVHLESARANIHLQISEVLFKELKDPKDNSSDTWMGVFGSSCIDRLREYSLLPTNLRKISGIGERFERLPPLQTFSSNSQRFSQERYRTNCLASIQNITQYTGLCLRCVQSNQGNPKACKHDN